MHNSFNTCTTFPICIDALMIRVLRNVGDRKLLLITGSSEHRTFCRVLGLRFPQKWCYWS